MKFVDEAASRCRPATAAAARSAFAARSSCPFGGPDGGDGGDGGSVYLVAQRGLNTLADFRYQRTFKAGNGEPGGSARLQRPGRRGSGKSPCRSARCLRRRHRGRAGRPRAARRTRAGRARRQGRSGQPALQAQHEPRAAQGDPGHRARSASCELELKLLADVGLLGLPNAGKSTLISAVSAARPKIADYPFTTLHPNLGVVYVGEHQSFVMADIPGLIEGAAEGAGLGIRFLQAPAAHAVAAAPGRHRAAGSGSRSGPRCALHRRPS